MIFTQSYASPVGLMTMQSDGNTLTGLQFGHLPGAGGTLPVFEQVTHWLDIYFSGKVPDFDIPLSLCGTEFQKQVWAILRTVPYGKTASYGEIAAILAEKRDLARMSAQAVGNAVGKNPVGIIVPCHRVIGADGTLVGFAAGLEIKKKLLQLEGAIP